MKMSITTSDTQQMKDHLLSLPKQGSFPANAQDDNQALWSEVISTLPEQTFKFILNASLDTLPTNHNLFLWKKRPTCVVQYVHYVINPMNLSYNIYNPCHDSVHEKIGHLFPNIYKRLKPLLWISQTPCIPSLYILFPAQIVQILSGWTYYSIWDNLWCSSGKEIHTDYWVDIIIYLNQHLRYVEYASNLITVEVGSRGLVNTEGFKSLKKLIKASTKDMNQLMTDCSRLDITGSFKIWCSCNSSSPTLDFKNG